jgi:hypothetical protein
MFSVDRTTVGSFQDFSPLFLWASPYRLHHVLCGGKDCIQATATSCDFQIFFPRKKTRIDSIRKCIGIRRGRWRERLERKGLKEKQK